MEKKSNKKRFCLFCGKILTGQKRKFCTDTHSTAYYTAIRELKIQNTNPESYIKEQLEKPICNVPMRAKLYMDRINVATEDRIIPSCGNLQFSLGSNLFRVLKVKPGDIVKLTVEVIKRKWDE